jgi:hypothetical protein
VDSSVVGEDELDIFHHISLNAEKTNPQHSGFFVYQSMPPYGTELIYIIKSGVLIDKDGKLNSNAALKMRIILSRSSPSAQT